MKLESIKTKAEFYEFADIQYQRLHVLRCIWQDENELLEKRKKAFRLWGVMFKRLLKLNQIAIKLSQYKNNKINKK